MRIRVLLFLISVLLPSGRALAQATTYPVQVNANILPPYSLYLSDYYSGTREKLAVTLINRDQLKPTLNVRLRMIITAPGGLRIQTNDNTYIPPIQVENGIPLRLTRDDLEPYFQPNALITSGYLTDGRLPEGMIEFCFQAIEAYTGQVLSTSTCARAFITSQKPPLLSLPQNNESVPFRDPLNLLFQWTPRHQGVAFVEYDVIIKELWDNGMTPQAAFSYSPEIFRETTRSTSMLYGAMQPPLLPGKRYAWCVRAQAREGMDAINVFQNDGYSEIRTFTLQSDCAAPELVKATAERTRLNVSWDPLPQHIGFTVSYRLKDGDTVGEWQEKQTLEPEVQITGLKMAGTYEYRIGSYCVAGQPVYSPILSITLPKKDTARLAQCGFMPEVNLANQEPIKTLNTGDIFMANDYPVTITRISGSDGVFSGEGWTEVPWLADVKLAVQYTSIKINTDKQLIDGYIDAKYDKTEGQIADLDDVFEGGQDVGNVKTGLTRVDYAVDFSIPGVESFSVNDDGNLVIKDSDGDANVVTPKDLEGTGNEGNKVMVFPMTVKDKDGVVYQVVATETDEQGKATAVKATKIAKQGTKLAADSFNPTQLNGDKAIVTFIKGAGKYPFDTWKDYYAGISLIKSNYEKLYNDYYAPWKFLTVGQGDVVSARISIKDNVVKPENVIFKTPAGIEYDATYTDGVYTLQIASGPVGDVQELYALYPDPSAKEKYWTLGKLGIATYAAQSYKLVLVPVEDAPVDVEDIRTMLKTVYDSIGVTWQVELAPSLSYKEDKLMANSTGLSTYNDAMRNLNAAYKDAVQAAGGRFDEGANYLFFLKATGADKTNERDYTGFMPRGAQFGYIFTSELRRKQIPQVVAHELGHGRWKLFHPFDSHYGSVTAAEKTDNLMSYGENAGSFAKWQWDIVNDPAMLVSVFGGDSKSAYAEKNYIVMEKDRVFLSPAGTPVHVPANSRIYSISVSGNIWPGWALYKFEYYNKSGGYQSISMGASSARNGTFFGYFDFTTEGATTYWTPNKDWRPVFKKDNNTGTETVIQTVTLISEDPKTCTIKLYEVEMTFVKGQIKSYVNGNRNTPGRTADYDVSNLKAVDSSKPLQMRGCTDLSDIGNNESFNGSGKPSQNVFIDYSEGRDGTSPFTGAGKDSLATAMTELTGFLQMDVKTYILNTDNPSFDTAKKAYDEDGAENKVLIVVEGNKSKIRLEHRLTAPAWLRSTFPSNGADDCTTDYVNKALDELHAMSVYTIASTIHKIQMEYSLALYKTVFGNLYCATDERHAKNWSPGVQFAGGAFHELISNVDVVMMVEGILAMGKSIVKMKIDSYDSYITGIKQTCDEIKNNKPIEPSVLLQRAIPPDARFVKEACENVVKIATQFTGMYFTDCQDICWYRRGEVTVMIVPIVLTMGEWAYVKVSTLTARFTGTKSGRAVALLKEADDLGMEVVQTEGKSATKIVESTTSESGEVSREVVTTIERNGDDIVIEGREPLGKKGILDNIDDLEDGQEYVKVFGQGNDLQQVSQWIGKIDDKNRIYIAVHGADGTFHVVHNGVNHVLDHRSLAAWIEANPELGKKDIVLLTCADSRAAQNLANKLSGNRKVISWDGVTEVYENGYIRGEGNCYIYTKSNNAGLNQTLISGDAIPHGNGGEPVGRKVVLGVSKDASVFAKYENLMPKIAKLRESDAQRFIRDFEEASEDVLKQLNENTKLVDNWRRFGESPLRTNTKYLNAALGYPSTWKFEFSGDVTKLYDGSGRELASLSEYVAVAKGGTKADRDWNQFLNKATMPDHQYEVDGYLYKTDNMGRVEEVSGDLRDIERGRNTNQQGASVELKDGFTGEDDGGHLIANMLDGPGEQINYLPMDASLNRGDWKVMENEWRAALGENKSVRIKITPIFEGSLKRPDRFEVEYWINDGLKKKFFDN